MKRLEVENTTADELRQQIERSAKQAVEMGLREMRETIERFADNAYLNKTWLTLEEAASYADVSLGTLRDWRRGELSESKVGDRVYVKRADLDAFIESHVDRSP